MNQAVRLQLCKFWYLLLLCIILCLQLKNWHLRLLRREIIDFTILSGHTTWLRRMWTKLGKYGKLRYASVWHELYFFNEIRICTVYPQCKVDCGVLFEFQLKSTGRVLFRSVTIESRNNKDESIAIELGNQVFGADTINSPAKAVVLSCIIDVLCKYLIVHSNFCVLLKVK